MAEPRRLADSVIHLGLGATAVPRPPFDRVEWYEAYGRHPTEHRPA